MEAQHLRREVGAARAPGSRAPFATLAALALALAAVCTACTHRERIPVSAILITLDTTRADALGCYGGPAGLTPSLDRLASESVCYTNARTVAPLTLPAHASMLTGLYPPRHTLRDNGLRALPASAETLAESCRARGLQTAAFVSAVVLDHAFGLDQGFDVYDQPPRPKQQGDSHYSERAADDTARAARAWLARRDRARPFFLWIHFFDAHVPYRPPQPFLERARGDAYRGEIAFVDSELGRLLGELRADGTLDSTLVIVTADHGESLGEHGEPTHGAFCYDATLRVPLLVRWPDGARAGETDDALVSVVDIAPTVRDALRLARDAPEASGASRADGALDGASLAREHAQGERAPGGVYCESYSGYLNYGWSPLAGWITRAGKYLHSSSPEFYELARDPAERRDAVAEHAADAEVARRAIEALLARSALRAPTADAEVPESFRRDLRVLGYAAIGREADALPSPLAASDLPAPRARADELEPLLIANALGDAGRYADALAPLERIVAGNPRHALALDLLAFDLMQLGRFEDARARLAQRLALGAERADTHLNLAVCLERAGELALARQHYVRALALDPEDAPALEALARLDADSPERAEAWRRRLDALGRGGSR